MSDNTYYIAGNLTKDPVVSSTPNGTTVVNFTIATTTRVLNPQTSQYKDTGTVFMRCTAWRALGEHVAKKPYKRHESYRIRKARTKYIRSRRRLASYFNKAQCRGYWSVNAICNSANHANKAARCATNDFAASANADGSASTTSSAVYDA